VQHPGLNTAHPARVNPATVTGWRTPNLVAIEEDSKIRQVNFHY